MSHNPYQSPQAPQGYDTYAPAGSVSPGVIRELLGTKPWVRLVAVLFFIGAILMLIGGLIGMVAGSSIGVAGAGIIIGLIYIVFGIIYLIPAMKLWGYGSAINTVAIDKSPQSLELAISQQRQFWKFTGIMIIISFVLVIVMAIVTASMASRASSQMQSGQFQADFEKAMREAQERSNNQ